MKNRVNKYIWIILSIVLFFLFSYASGQQEQTGSMDAEAYNNRGIAYGKKGQFDQAISDLTKALKINPRYARAYYNRGIAYGKKDQYDQAISDYTKALEINPRFAGAYYNRGIAYYYKREYDKSLEDVKKAQNLGYQTSPKFLETLRKASGRPN
jgi:tetratricopeptide (TPR) repeat protein